MEELMRTVFYDPTQGFSGETEFLRRIRLVYPKATNRLVKKWLEKQPTYTMHKPARRKYERNKVLVSGIDEQWQADLVDMQKLTKFNDGYRYILTCIDLFSKFAWAIPLVSKTSENVKTAFLQIFSTGRRPYKLQTDAGSEFINKEVQKFLKEHDVDFFTTNSEMKASVVERFNRTLKEKMWKYFTKENTFRYINVLSSFLNNYNSSFHRTIGMKPVDVSAKNENQILNKAFRIDLKKKPFKFDIGDDVRISKVKKHFEKGYTPNWTEEYFTVHQRIARNPPVYTLKIQMGEQVDGVFYESELQKIDVSPVDLHVIEKIIRQRRKNNKTEYFVKWRGYPEKFNSWTSDIIKL
jgi:hypothetical protein